jgi:tRNA pseudouridine38-40 synthase
MRYALLIEYNGANYKGWQKQRGLDTIQERIESVLSTFANHNIEINAAGRTDAGVHALGQTATFDSSANRQLYGWKIAANSMLPGDIRIKDVAIVDDQFHARFDAVARTYQYYLYNSSINSAIIPNSIGYFAYDLDIELMRQASQFLLGEQDFSAFRTSICQAKSPIRTMMSIKIEKQNNVICFEFTANAFLHHMIRNIVGAMVYIGSGRLSIQDFETKFISKNRGEMPPTFMPNGLYLSRIKYQSEIFLPQKSHWMFNL